MGEKSKGRLRNTEIGSETRGASVPLVLISPGISRFAIMALDSTLYNRSYLKSFLADPGNKKKGHKIIGPEPKIGAGDGI